MAITSIADAERYMAACFVAAAIFCVLICWLFKPPLPTRSSLNPTSTKVRWFSWVALLIAVALISWASSIAAVYPPKGPEPPRYASLQYQTQPVDLNPILDYPSEQQMEWKRQYENIAACAAAVGALGLLGLAASAAFRVKTMPPSLKHPGSALPTVTP